MTVAALVKHALNGSHLALDARQAIGDFANGALVDFEAEFSARATGLRLTTRSDRIGGSGSFHHLPFAVYPTRHGLTIP